MIVIYDLGNAKMYPYLWKKIYILSDIENSKVNIKHFNNCKQTAFKTLIALMHFAVIPFIDIFLASK